MPHVGVHLLLAERILSAWEPRPRDAPFLMSAPTRNAFRHGALGPDLGYFPGADAHPSDLAHHVHPVSLVRALIRHASDDVQLAYGWGWLTHVLGDVAIHPLVNERCGEMRLGLRVPLLGDEAPAEHIAVEVGLDLALSRELGPVVRPLAPIFETPCSADFVAAAYQETYGEGPSGRECARAHQRVVRCVRALSGLHRLAGGRGRASLRVLKIATRRGTPARGLFEPDSAPSWLMDAVRGVVGGFEEWYLGHYRSDLYFLPERDLWDGRLLESASERRAA